MREANLRVDEMFGDTPIARAWETASCVGKVAFDSPQMAARVAAKHKVPGDHYRCRVCGLWHVGWSRGVK